MKLKVIRCLARWMPSETTMAVTALVAMITLAAHAQLVVQNPTRIGTPTTVMSYKSAKLFVTPYLATTARGVVGVLVNGTPTQAMLKGLDSLNQPVAIAPDGTFTCVAGRTIRFTAYFTNLLPANSAVTLSVLFE